MRQRHHDDEGVTLVELMVAVFILGLVMAGIASLSASGLRVTRINTERTVASNLIQSEMERIRSLTFASVEEMVGEPETWLASTSGVQFRLRRAVDWAPLEATSDLCGDSTVGGDAQAMLRVDVTAWSVTAPDSVSRSETHIARPPTGEAATTGALTVRVTDHQTPPQGVGQVQVQVQAPNGTVHNATTASDGCASFDNLTPGNHNVTVERSNHVSNRLTPNRSTPSIEAGVSGGLVTVLDVAYAPSGSARLQAVPSVQNAAVPTNLPVTLGKDGLVEVRPDRSVFPNLWPAGHSVWVGDCPAADPEGVVEGDQARWPGASRQAPVVVQPANQASADVVLPTVRVRVQAARAVHNGQTIHAATRITAVRARAAEACPNGTSTLTFALPELTIPAASHIDGDLGLPYGVWDVDVRGQASAAGSPWYDVRATGRVTVSPSSDTPTMEISAWEFGTW